MAGPPGNRESEEELKRHLPAAPHPVEVPLQLLELVAAVGPHPQD